MKGVKTMRRIYWITFLLALLLSAISYTAWAQNDLTCTTCPIHNTLSVPTDIAVNVVFNQDIDLLGADGITMKVKSTGESLAINPHVNQYVLWLRDPWKPNNTLPDSATIEVYIPAVSVAAKDGTHPAADIIFSFTTASNNKHFLTSFVTPLTGDKNNPPVANPDNYSVPTGSTLQINAPGVLGNDTDADGDTLTAVAVDNPDHGTLTQNPDGSFTYKPDTGYTGPDSFSYKANDGKDDSNEATVTITVTPVSTSNNPPVANPDNYSIPTGNTLQINAPGVLGNDIDVDGDTLTAVAVDNPDHGTLTQNPDGSFTYKPDTGYTGPDSFSYKANDGKDDSNEATVTITVTPVSTSNNPPVANPGNYSVPTGSTQRESIKVPKPALSSLSNSGLPISSPNQLPVVIPPVAAPKMPNTGVEPVDEHGPWQIAAGIYLMALLLLVILKRKELFSCKR